MASSLGTFSVETPIYQTTPRNQISESPIYRQRDHTLHWIDLRSTPPGTLHILPLSPSTSLPVGPARIVHTSLPVTAIRFIANRPGKYICGYSNGVGILDEETGKVEVQKELIGQGEKGWSMNDGAVDPQGRFWVGEIDLPAMGAIAKGKGNVVSRGRLWRFGIDGEATVMAEGVTLGNGIGWSPDGRYMYFNDSGTQTLWRFDFDGATGNISNGKKIIDGLPGKSKNVLNDGLVVDQEGNIWVAMWMDSCVKVYSPEGKELKTITFPAKCITCPGWGGPNSDVLFVSTALPLDGSRPEGDEGGHLFRFDAGVKGVVNHEFGGSSSLKL